MRGLTNRIIFLIRLIISLVLVLFLLSQIDYNLFLNILRESHKGFMMLAFLVLFFNYFFCFLRWLMIVKEFELDVSKKLLYVYFCGGLFFNAILPSSIGGDLVRSIDLALYTSKTKEVLASVILDRLSGYVGLMLVLIPAVILGLIGKLVILNHFIIISSILTIAIVLLTILLIFFNKRIFDITKRFLDLIFGLFMRDKKDNKIDRLKETLKSIYFQIHSFHYKPSLLIKNILLSFVIQLIGPLVSYLIGLSLGIKVDFLYFLIIIPIVGAVSLLPISLGGLGIRESLTVFFFNYLGVKKELALGLSFVGSVFLLVYSIIAGVCYVFGIHHRRL